MSDEYLNRQLLVMAETFGAQPEAPSIRRFDAVRVVGVFANQASCLRLVSALARKVSDKWEDGKVYLTLTA